MSLDISGDYAIFDNAVEVVVSLKESGKETKLTISNGLKGALGKRDQAALLDAGQFTGNEATWFIPDAQLNPNGETREMKPGYTIDDRTNVWRVLLVNEVSVGSSRSGWNCVCQRHLDAG